jgi:hypothetical protein
MKALPKHPACQFGDALFGPPGSLGSEFARPRVSFANQLRGVRVPRVRDGCGEMARILLAR